MFVLVKLMFCAYGFEIGGTARDSGTDLEE